MQFDYDWQEIRTRYRKLLSAYLESGEESGEGRKIPEGTGSEQRTMLGGWADGGYFYDATAAEMLDRIKNGYSYPQERSKRIPSFAEIDRPKWRWSDDAEGELDVSAALNGEPECYRVRTQTRSRAGVRIVLELGFQAGVPAETLADYSIWAGAAVAAIQAQGLDVEITVESRSKNTYGRHTGETDLTRIRVSRFGKTVMPKQWSALLSPGGFRHFIFFARAVSIDENGIRNGGMGGSQHPEWRVDFEPTTRTLTVGCDSINSASFPAAEMTEQLEQIRQEL